MHFIFLHYHRIAIRVFAKGKAFVHWTEQKLRGPGKPRYRDHRHHSATEEYFDYHYTILKNNGKCCLGSALLE